MKALFLLFTAASWSLWAQDTGRITGVITDPAGASVPKATITLMLRGGSAPVATAVSGAQGLFTLDTLRPVFYDLAVDAPGFQQFKMVNVKVDPSRATDLPPIKLQLATAVTAVNVTASAETVQTTSPEVSTTVTNEQISRLPVGDRNPLAFISTQAGVNPTQYETSINGERSSFSNVTLDGINIQDNYIRTGGLDYTPSQLTLDQVQEFTVVTSNQDSAAGGGTSQVNFTTPSGGNNLHGDVYWQNRNNALAANDWFNNQDGIRPPRLNLNQAGGSISGPIKRDRLFYFFNYEAYRFRNEATANQTILTADARKGIFTYRDTRGQIQKADILKLVGLQFDPVMSALLAQVPGPEKINNTRVGDSVPGQPLMNTAGYSFLVRNNRDKDNVTTKLNYYLSAKNALTGTFAWNRDTVDRPDLGVAYSTTPAVQNDDARKFVSISWRWNPTPNLVNEVRGGGFLAPATFGYSGKLPSYLVGGMIYSTPDPAAASSILAQGRNTRTFAGSDNASWVHGRHTVKFGYQYQGVRVRTYDFTGTVPVYNVGIDSTNQTNNLLFAGDLPRISPIDLDTANSLLASLAGLLNDASATYNVTSQSSGFVPGSPYLRHFSLDNHAFYGQDEWKLLRNLTLTGGLRWDYFSPVDERDSLELQPLLMNGNARTTLLSNATLYYSGNSIGRPFYNKDLNNFGPRAGLAWDVFGNGRTSIRAGYSLDYGNDEAITVTEAFTAANPGLQSFLFQPNLSGTMALNRPVLTAPDFHVPLTFADAYADNPGVFFGLVDPGLRAPYVQQWNFAIQQEIKGTIIEARYVGNHATKLIRGFDYNQEDIRANGFLADFLKAQQNGFLAQNLTGTFNPAYNRSIAGSQPLPVFGQLFSGGFLNNSTVRSLIQQGEPGELGFLYQVNGINGSLNFFPNPNALVAALVTNYSNATYNSVQIDARRRLQQGLEFQANYVFSKVLSDAAGIDQLRYEPFLDINNPKLARSRTPVDLTQSFKVNYSYELPLGEGHYVHKRGLNRVLAGWMTSGSLEWISGNPLSIYSGRGTFLRESFSGINEANSTLTKPQIDQLLKVRMTGNGPFFLPATAIGADGRGVAPDGQPAFNGQIFTNPTAGNIGTLTKRMFTGPSVFDMDAALRKTTHFNERIAAELRLEALNVFNHPSFAIFAQNINSTQFGKITSTAVGARELQLMLKVTF